MQNHTSRTVCIAVRSILIVGIALRNILILLRKCESSDVPQMSVQIVQIMLSNCRLCRASAENDFAILQM